MLRRFCTVVLAAVLLTFSVVASDMPEAGSDIIVSDIPVTYGDEAFRERILEKTKGQRDPVGLVLTGGSARALSHLGVLEYLEENGIVPDFIISNSMGSIIAMLYAAGMTPDQIVELLMSSELSTLFSFTLPLEGGIILPSGFETMIETIIGPDTRLEDLDIPVMVVCDDLVTKREVRITSGDFTDVLLASFALPFYFPPREYEGHLLIDGGVISLLPLEAAYEYTDTVIVSTSFYNAADVNLKNAITVLNTSFDVGKNQKAAETLKEHEDFIWIRCAVENFSFMDFDKALLMKEIGYRSAAVHKEELEDIFHSGVDENLVAKRMMLGDKLAEATKDLEYFSRIDAASPEQSLTFAFESDQGKEYRKYLNDTADLTLRYGYRNGGIETGAEAGAAFDLTTHAVAAVYPLVGGFFRYYPLDMLRLTFDMSVTLCHEPWYVPNIYLRQGFDWVILHDEGLYDLRMKEALELNTGFAQNNTAMAASLAFDGEYSIWYFDIYGTLGYLMTSDDTSFWNMHNYLEIAASTRFRVPVATEWFADLGVFSRVAVDGKGDVPLFLSDGYSSTALGAGSGYTRLSNYHNTILSFSAGYDFPQTPTASEFLIFDDMELSLYCDVLFHDAAVSVSTGAEAQVAISMLGLTKLPLRIRLGYDSLANSFVSSFLITLKYHS